MHPLGKRSSRLNLRRFKSYTHRQNKEVVILYNSPYKPIGLKKCCHCGGSGIAPILGIKIKRRSPYQIERSPVCGLCRGSGVVVRKDLKRVISEFRIGSAASGTLSAK